MEVGVVVVVVEVECMLVVVEVNCGRRWGYLCRRDDTGCGGGL